MLKEPDKSRQGDEEEATPEEKAEIKLAEKRWSWQPEIAKPQKDELAPGQ